MLLGFKRPLNAYISLLVLCGLIYPAYGEGLFVNDDVKQANNAIEQYKREAASMSASKIYKEIETSQEMLRLKQNSTGFVFPDIKDKDTQKGTGFLSALEERRKANDPAAAFYFGLYQIRLCLALKENNDLGNTAQNVCNDAIDSLKVAIEANDPRAMRALGTMYKEGIGVNVSKFVAADWFVKAAKQYEVESSREGALSAAEEALNSVPEHIGALAIRKELLK